MTEAITPFTLSVSESDLADLRRRLEATRWPEKETVDDWTQGAPLAKVQALCRHWATDYDWRRAEARLNALGQFKTRIDDLDLHFLHVRSPHSNALPLIITHGWPGSVMEFMKVIGPLTDPTAHGGKAEDAFHVIAPSLPGFGFSERPSTIGWNVERIAKAWSVLMGRLGYDRWVAQGGDWGAAVTTGIGVLRPAGCAAIHVNMPLVFPDAEDLGDMSKLTPREQSALGAMAYYQAKDSGYSKQQSTRPQSLAYGLTDSPSGQAAWIYEKCGPGPIIRARRKTCSVPMKSSTTSCSIGCRRPEPPQPDSIGKASEVSPAPISTCPSGLASIPKKSFARPVVGPSGV